MWNSSWLKCFIKYGFTPTPSQDASGVFAALVEYKSMSKKTLQESIESEMSGNLQKLLVAVGEAAPDLLSRELKLHILDQTLTQLFSSSSKMCEECSCIFCREAFQSDEGKIPSFTSWYKNRFWLLYSFILCFSTTCISHRGLLLSFKSPGNAQSLCLQN